MDKLPKAITLFGKSLPVRQLHELAGVAVRKPFKVELFRARAGEAKKWTVNLRHSTDNSWLNVICIRHDPHAAVREAELHLTRIAGDIYEALK